MAIDLLRLNTLEASSVFTDSTREPHTIELELVADGPIDPEVVRHSLAIAMATHPMARMSLKPPSWWTRRLRWRPLQQIEPPVFVRRHPWLGGESPASRMVGLDGPGFEVHLFEDRLVMAVNHAVFDGLGAVRLLRSMCAASVGDHDPLPDVDPLSVRYDRGGTQPASPAPAPAATRMRSGPIAHFCDAGVRGAAGTWIVHRALTAPRPAPGATVNDLLQTAWHLTLAEELGPTADLIRVLMPVNARPAGWADQVVGNHAFLAFVDTDRADRATSARALAAVVDQTSAIRNDPSPSAVLELIGSGLVPYGPARAAIALAARAGRRSIATASLSNLGRLAPMGRIGGATIQQVWFSPPCRSPRGAALGVTGYDGQLLVSVRTRRSTFTLGATESLAERVCAKIVEPVAV